jgi:predicted outer membrane repeat protein
MFSDHRVVGLSNVRHSEKTSAMILPRALAQTVLLVAFGAGTSAAVGATLDVCKKGCVYETVQAAINAARPNDTIQIAAGTYFENVIATKALWLLGAGEDATIIDGSFRGPVISAGGTGNFTVEDLTVTHGGQGGIIASFTGMFKLQGSIVASNWGPGIYLPSTNATIVSSLIAHNESRAGRYGGGISTGGDLGFDAYITITNSSIVRNSAPSGGGIYADYNENFTISGSTIADNTATEGGGGGILVHPKTAKDDPGGSLTISTTTIAGNHAAGDGGGICGYGFVDSVVVFSNNSAGRDGGGMATSGGCGDPSHAPVNSNFLQIGDSTFTGNTAGRNGGGLSTSGDETLFNVIFNRNVAGNQGGGIYGNNVFVGGLYVVYNLALNNYGGVAVTNLYPEGAPLVITNNKPNQCSASNGTCPSP